MLMRLTTFWHRITGRFELRTLGELWLRDGVISTSGKRTAIASQLGYSHRNGGACQDKLEINKSKPKPEIEARAAMLLAVKLMLNQGIEAVWHPMQDHRRHRRVL